MMTRDSALWWWTMAAGLVLAASSRMDLIDPLLPASHTDKAHAVIELLAFLVSTISGVAKASPLGLSREAKEEYYRKEWEQERAKHLEKAKEAEETRRAEP